MNNLTIDLNDLSKKQIHKLYQSIVIINNQKLCWFIEKYWSSEQWELEQLKDKTSFKK